MVVAPGPSLEKYSPSNTNQERFLLAPLCAAGVLEKHNVRQICFQVDALNETEVEDISKEYATKCENLALEGNVSPFFEIETKNTFWTVMQEIDPLS